MRRSQPRHRDYKFTELLRKIYLEKLHHYRILINIRDYTYIYIFDLIVYI